MTAVLAVDQVAPAPVVATAVLAVDQVVPAPVVATAVLAVDQVAPVLAVAPVQVVARVAPAEVQGLVGVVVQAAPVQVAVTAAVPEAAVLAAVEAAVAVQVEDRAVAQITSPDPPMINPPVRVYLPANHNKQMSLPMKNRKMIPQQIKALSCLPVQPVPEIEAPVPEATRMKQKKGRQKNPKASYPVSAASINHSR